MQTSMESNKDVPFSNRKDAGHLIMMYIHRNMNMNIHVNYDILNINMNRIVQYEHANEYE